MFITEPEKAQNAILKLKRKSRLSGNLYVVPYGRWTLISQEEQ
jgi:hypothetical protein